LYDLDALRPLVQVTNDDKTLLDFLKKFEVIGKVFVSTAVITALTRGVIEQAAHDNIKYLELRFAPVYMTSACALEPKAVIEAIVEGAEQGTKEWNLPVNLIVVIERNRGVQEAWDLLTPDIQKVNVCLSGLFGLRLGAVHVRRSLTKDG
jgi:adenosine deaminase